MAQIITDYDLILATKALAEEGGILITMRKIMYIL